MDDFDIAEFLEECEQHTASVQDANKYLERLSKFLNGKRYGVIHIVKTVTSVMRRYENEREVQSMGMVCLENFFRHNKIYDLDFDTIDKLANQLIIIIESHSDDDQMMKSALRILSDPIILRGGKFDSCRCLKAVINYFVTSRDPEVDDWAVKICFKLSSKVESDKTITFYYPPEYQTKLLSMIRPHAKSKPIDPTAIIALKSLVYLTSANSPVCEILIKDGDVEMFIEMLDTFQGETAVEDRLLAILYDVVEEVKLFRQQLTQRPLFISKICQLLDSDHISVSFKAAGVMAYLLLEIQRSQNWHNNYANFENAVEIPTRAELLDQLHRVIMNWKVPETEELASYRSFNPLYSLLQSKVYPVQLYAAWCIYHCCVVNSNIYYDKLDDENGMELLQTLEADETTHSDVRNMCRNIHKVYLKDLESLDEFYYLFESDDSDDSIKH